MIRVVWRLELVLVDGEWRLELVPRLVRVRVRVYVTNRWTVNGVHWEDAGQGVTRRETTATGCNWESTFDRLGR